MSNQMANFMNLLAVGLLLTFIFVGLAYLIALSNNNRMKGFGLAIVMWLFLAVIYDGLFILSLIVFEDYPLETFSLISSMLNPIDLSRILIMLKLDVAALLGYTGAVFNKFLGTTLGVGVAFMALIFWIILPLTAYLKIATKKDF